MAVQEDLGLSVYIVLEFYGIESITGKQVVAELCLEIVKGVEANQRISSVR